MIEGASRLPNPMTQHKRGVDAVILVDKPAGVSSFDVVRRVRRSFGQRRVGHAGTLDPAASGLLVVCLGQGTKLVPYLMDGAKTYLADVALGAQTDTDDAEGEVIATAFVPDLSREKLEEVLERFVGEIEQVPPVYCALKRSGEALYKKARRGERVEMRPRPVKVYEIRLTSFQKAAVQIEVTCGKGTYIRSIARDLGEALGTKGHLRGLRRTRSCSFEVGSALTFDELARLEQPPERDGIMSLESAAAVMERLDLDAAQTQDVRCGRPVSGSGMKGDLRTGVPFAAFDPSGRLVAVVELKEGFVRVLRGFSSSQYENPEPPMNSLMRDV